MSLLAKLIIFMFATAGIAWLSWPSLRSVRSHGFYRFFAFVAAVALVLLNVEYWFVDPFSVLQFASWILLIISVLLVVHSTLLLHRVGQPGKKRSDPTLCPMEKTTKLVTIGIYRYIRHPIYSAGLVGAWGVYLKQHTWLGLTLAVVATIAFYITAKMEEVENVRFFGEEYQDYMKRTKMFVPFLF